MQSDDNIILNGKLIEIIRQSSYSIQHINSVKAREIILHFLIEKLNGSSWSSSYIESVKREVKKFCLIVVRKWSKISRNYNLFIKNNVEWLKQFF